MRKLLTELKSFKFTSKNAATIVAVAASIYFSLSQMHNQKIRQQRDLEIDSGVLADGLREAVEPLLGFWGKSSRLQEFADRFGKRGHLAGIAVFDKGGKLLVRSASLNKNLVHLPRIAQNALKSNREAEGYDFLDKRRMRVNAVPLSNGGVLAVFHDPAYIETRMNRARMESVWRMVYQGAIFVAAILVFELLF